MVIKKEEFVKTLIVSWFIVATLYVGYDIWNDYKAKGVDAAYKAGVSDTINQLIRQTEEKGCQPIEVYSGEKKVEFIDMACLQSPETELEGDSVISE